MIRRPLPSASSERFRPRGIVEATGERLRCVPLGAGVRRWTRRAYHAALMLQTGGRGIACDLPGGERVRSLPEHRYLSWNRLEYEAFRQEVRPGMFVLDVGANVGAYSLLLGQWVGPAGRVFAFEPAPQTFRGLCGHVRLNGLDEVVRPFDVAVGDRETIAELLAAETAGESRLAGPGDAHGVRVSVPVVTIDSFCRREAVDPGFIKIDVEGGELAVLRGARDTISRCGDRLALFVEWHPSLWPCLGTSREELMAELREQRLDPISLGQDDVWATEGVAVRLVPR